MQNLKVSLKKEKELSHKLRKAKVFKKDIKESFILSSGPGGQNVNKTSTCVSLLHVPTGIRVKSQQERSQSANRYVAYELLLKKVLAIHEKEELQRQRELHKIKKNKSIPRPARIQEEVLKEKHIRSEKKSLRKKVNYDSSGDDI